MSILISNEHLAAGERFDCWRETLCQSRLAPVEARADNEADFRFSMRYNDLGTARVSVYTAMPYNVRRTPRLIRESSPDLLALSMPLSGHGSLAHAGRQTFMPQGSLCLYETWRPYHVDAAGPGTGTGRGLMIAFPRTLLPLPDRKLRQVTAMAMPAGPGIGTLTSRLLADLAAGMDHYTRGEASRLFAAALEVLAVRLAHALDTSQSLPPETRSQALLTTIHAFIQQHISDPDLAPETIAAAHHISLRLLHKLFHDQGDTVAGWIRARRLEGTRRELADPAQATRPVAALAAHWGFRTPASVWGMPRGVSEMDAAGLLGPDQVHVHCNGLSEPDWQALARAGAKISISVETELNMGMGRPVFAACERHGLSPTLSCDIIALNSGDMFSQLRQGLGFKRWADAETVNLLGADPARVSTTALEALRWSTVYAAEAVGLEDRIGSLTPGKQADLIIVGGPGTAQHPVIDAAGTLIFQTSKADVRTVLVAGRAVKRDGVMTGVDLPRLVEQADTSADQILKRVRAAVPALPATPPEGLGLFLDTALTNLSS
jgi:cytosine/adenosine deaminase-related metal-dependent hydrolase